MATWVRFPSPQKWSSDYNSYFYILEKYKNEYTNYNIYLCVDKKLHQWYNNLNLDNVELSFDFEENLKHICSCKVYVGGDTGLSHFAGALENGPEPVYYTSSRGLLHTTPFYWYTHKKGTMKTYWLDFERTEWQ